MLEAFAGDLTARDHRNRMEMYLFKENAEGALRSAQRAGADHVKLAQARIAMWPRGAARKALIDSIPASLRNDSSYQFALAQFHRRSNEAHVSAAVLDGVTRDVNVLVDGDEWWVERRLIARQLLSKGDAATAYRVVAAHSAERTHLRIEAEWHAGWIALRFLSQPDVAARHFAAAAALAETPISIGRTAYWQGRAAEAAGDAGAAEAFYRRAAAQKPAFYGQLARARLDLPDLPIPEVQADPGGIPALRVAALLDRAGLRQAARPLLIELGRTLDAPEAMQAAAEIAQRAEDPRLLVGFGKLALQRGMPLMRAAYPTGGLPATALASSPVERAMLHAIARQESAFDPKAVSHAGARGLMQLMPATARVTAQRAALPFNLAALTADPAYNARIGAAHLADLLKEWRGSYILTFASYNAGSHNVQKWIAMHGDPRDPKVDPIDWIEQIPFTETRDYVQRVMENLQVYRARLHESHPLVIAVDFTRGVRRHPFAGESGPAEIARAPAARPPLGLAALP